MGHQNVKYSDESGFWVCGIQIISVNMRKLLEKVRNYTQPESVRHIASVPFSHELQLPDYSGGSNTERVWISDGRSRSVQRPEGSNSERKMAALA